MYFVYLIKLLFEPKTFVFIWHFIYVSLECMHNNEIIMNTRIKKSTKNFNIIVETRTILCRHYETLAHILRECLKSKLLRNNGHNRICGIHGSTKGGLGLIKVCPKSKYTNHEFSKNNEKQVFQIFIHFR